MSFGFLPAASFFVAESYDALRRSGLGAHHFLESNAQRIRQARARLKLLDSSGFDEAQRQLANVEEASHRMFNSGHRGVLASLKKWLQDDLGLYFIGPDLVSTTHVALLNFTYHEQDLRVFDHRSLGKLGREIHLFSRDLGSFIGEIAAAFNEPLKLPDVPPLGLVISAEDHKARIAYDRLAARLQTGGSPMAALFTWLASQTNFVHGGLRAVLGPESDFFFRIRFLTVFHLLHALQKIGAVLRGNRGSALGAIAAELQAREGARWIRRQDRLRNAMAHYDGASIAGMNGSPLNLLIATLSGSERTALSVQLDDELEAACVCFRRVLEKGSLGRREVSR